MIMGINFIMAPLKKGYLLNAETQRSKVFKDCIENMDNSPVFL